MHNSRVPNCLKVIEIAKEIIGRLAPAALKATRSMEYESRRNDGLLMALREKIMGELSLITPFICQEHPQNTHKHTQHEGITIEALLR